MSEIEPRCGGCKYNLTGLGRAGRCPECGVAFNQNVYHAFAERPPFGRGLLLVGPLLVVPTTLIAYEFLFAGGLCLIFAGPLLFLGLCIFIAMRLTDWRYCRAHLHAGKAKPPPSRARFLISHFAPYLMIQVVLILAAFEASRHLLGWLVSIGFLSRGWS